MITLDDAKTICERNAVKGSRNAPRETPRIPLEWKRVSKYTEESSCKRFTAGAYGNGRGENGKTLWRFEAWAVPSRCLGTDLDSIIIARELCQQQADAEA